MRTIRLVLGMLLTCGAAIGNGAVAQTAFEEAPLPPVLPWSGASEKLVAAKDDPWITPAERDDFVETPNYTATRA